MPRTFSKILIVCAMIFLFPLMIVGTTYAGYYSIDASIIFDLSITSPDTVEDGLYAKIYAGTQEINRKTTYTDGHLKIVKLTADAVGYDFLGWYNGDQTSYELDKTAGTVNFVDTNKSIKVEMTEYDKILAVFEIKEYTVTYSYSETPNGAIVNTLPEVGADHFYYGEALPELSYQGYDYEFMGWKVKGFDKTYTTATFDAETVELEADWGEEKAKISIAYVDGSTELSSVEVYQKEPHEVVDLNTMAISFENGYRYSWIDEEGNAVEIGTEIVSEEDVTIYLNKEAIDYTVNIAGSDVIFAGTTETFNAEDLSSLEALFNNNETKYSFHTFAGISYDSTTYTDAQTLAQAIIDANPDGSDIALEVEGVATKDLTTVTATSGFSAFEKTYGENVYNQKDVGVEGAEWGLPSRTMDSSTTFYEYFNLLDGNGNIVSLYSEINGIQTELKLTNKLQVKIGTSTRTITVDVTATTTMNDVIEIALKNSAIKQNYQAGDKVFEVVSFTLIFEIA